MYYTFKDWLKTKQNLKKNNKMLKNIVNIGQKYASEKILDDLDNTNITSELKHQKFKFSVLASS